MIGGGGGCGAFLVFATLSVCGDCVVRYFPVDKDGIRSDVSVVLQETPALDMLPWIGDSLTDASRTMNVYLAKVLHWICVHLG